MCPSIVRSLEEHRPAPAAPEPVVGRGDRGTYVARAVARACLAIRCEPEGSRNNLVTREAFTLARFVREGQVTEDEIVRALVDAARSAGWTDMRKTEDTIRRAVAAGARA